MNVVQSSAALKLSKAEDSNHQAAVNLYNDIPTFELTLDEFELYALKRLKVLKKIEQLKTMRVPPDVSRQKVNEVIKQEGLSDPVADEASHFILRISYCQSEELRRWFLLYECALFQHRLRALSEDQLARSVASYARLVPISRADKNKHEAALMTLMTPTEYASAKFYAVPFAQALDLVASRQCYLHRGYAYISQSKVLSILVGKFRTELSRQLAVMGASGSFKSVDNPEARRVYPLLKNLHNCFVNREPEDVTLPGNQTLHATNVEQFVRNMPLCMRELHAGLKRDKKLKHWGRLQYGLFLKGAGMSVEDHTLFMQRHFAAVTGEEFQKQYAYGIRHMHGKEGARTNYTPYSCAKIIFGNAPSSSGEHHGCPYKHYDANHLAGLLQKLSVGTPADRSAILNLQKANHYQLACQKHFEVTHPNVLGMDISLDSVGNHPNAWFRSSVAYREKTTTAGDQQGGGSSSSSSAAAASQNNSNNNTNMEEESP